MSDSFLGCKNTWCLSMSKTYFHKNKEQKNIALQNKYIFSTLK